MEDKADGNVVPLAPKRKFDRPIAKKVRLLVRERSKVSPERLEALRAFMDRYVDDDDREEIEVHLDGLDNPD